MQEITPALHNMSAPPRSQIHIAPHRTNQQLFGIRLFPAITEQHWKEQILAMTHCATWEELQTKADAAWLPFIPKHVMVLSSGTDAENNILDPLVCVSILSRSVGTMWMQQREPILSFDRLSATYLLPASIFTANPPPLRAHNSPSAT
jgi:hypothetical protein